MKETNQSTSVVFDVGDVERDIIAGGHEILIRRVVLWLNITTVGQS